MFTEVSIVRLVTPESSRFTPEHSRHVDTDQTQVCSLDEAPAAS